MCVIHGTHEPCVAFKGCTCMAEILEWKKRDRGTKLMDRGIELVVSGVED